MDDEVRAMMELERDHMTVKRKVKAKSKSERFHVLNVPRERVEDILEAGD